MIDWNIVAKIAGGGYGITFIVLLTLSLTIWLTGMIIQRMSKENPEKNK